MAKNQDMTQGLGDITKILSNQGISDLSWLSVNEEEYRAFEALPKQNLDIVPELQKALAMEDEVPHVIPLRPHTVVNRNPSDILPVSAVDLTVPIRNRVAKLVMAGVPLTDLPKRLQLEFAHGDIVLAREAIQEVLSERGVLGNVYVDAKHFPRAAFDKKERKLALDLSKDALFVVSGCQGSGNCNCHQSGVCSTFGGKQVVSEVPWGPKVAAHYAPRLASEKRPVDFSGIGSSLPVSGREWKERLRAAFLQSPVASSPDGVKTAWTQQPAAPKKPLTREELDSFLVRRATSDKAEPLPSGEYMKWARRMMQGHDDRDMLVASGNPELAVLAGEFGLLGKTYLDMDALGSCRQALALVRQAGSIAPDFVVRRSATCAHCKCAEDGACAEIGRVSHIVDRRPPADIRSFARALLRATADRRISFDQAKVAAQNAKSLGNAPWTVLTARMNLFVPQKPSTAPYSGYKAVEHHAAATTELSRIPVDPEELRRSVSHLMNTGLTGSGLRAAVLSKYSARDLQDHSDLGRRLASEDGIQGVYFIDPTAYKDYGRGCTAGSNMFRKKEGSAPYVLASAGCTGCTYQTAPGWCSKYAKELIRQVPTQVRKASLEAKRKLPVVQATVENPVEQFELASEVSLDLGPARDSGPTITIPGHSVGD